MVLAVTMLVSVAPMHRTQAEGQSTDAECMTVHSNITHRDEHSEADERGDVTLLEGTPSSYVHLRDDVLGAITKEVGQTGFWQRLPRNTMLCPVCHNVAIELIPEIYAVPAGNGYTMTTPDIIGDCSFSIGSSNFAGYMQYPCLQFDYTAKNVGSTTVRLTFYYNYNFAGAQGNCNRCGQYLIAQPNTTWYEETVTFTVNVVSGSQPTPTQTPTPTPTPTQSPTPTQTPTPEPIQEHTVTFVDGLTGETINTQIVVAGEDAVAPEAPVHEGYTFVEWDTDFTNVQSDLTVTAVYAINEYTVTFVDGLTGETIDTQTVEHGADAVEPAVPEHVGYHFVGWDVDFTNVTSDLTVTAMYEINKYIVYVHTSSCGTASPLGYVEVEYGSSLTINMMPDAQHYVWYVSINGEIVAVRPGNVITIENITEYLDVFIMFRTDVPEVTPPAPTPGKPPKTGAISMTAIAIMAIVSGAGIILFRKK